MIKSGLFLLPGQTVGLFGGSFNPAHQGHLLVAKTALKRLGLDRVVWLVSPQNPLKSSRETAPLKDRMASARALITDRRMLVSDFETRAGTQFTIDTLKALIASHPGVKFVWIMGADNLRQFHRWHGWRAIAHLMPMAVIARPGALVKSRLSPTARLFAAKRLHSQQARLLAHQTAPAWVYLRVPLSNASSTALRATALGHR